MITKTKSMNIFWKFVEYIYTHIHNMEDPFEKLNKNQFLGNISTQKLRC